MTSKAMTTKIVSIFYSDDCKLKAQVMADGNRFYVDFYKDRILIGSNEIVGHTLRYAEDVAENYVLGVLDIDTEKMES